MAVAGNQIATLFVKLGADISEFERKMDRASSKVAKAGQGMQRAGVALTKAVTLPILAVAAVTGKAAVDFESAFTGVRKTVNATEQEFQNLRRGILDMNVELPATAGEIAGVAESAGQLGIETSAILSFTRTMIDLGETTNISAKEAATALARMANVMGTSQDKFQNLGSSVVELGNNLATTEAEIITMAQRISGAGKQVGLTEGEVLGFGAALSSVGIRADAGGTAISKVFIQIAKAVDTGSEKLDKFARVAGQSTDEFAESFKKDAAEATTRFIEGLGKVDAAGGSTFGVLEDLEIQERRMIDALLRTAGAGDLVREALKLGNDAFIENNALTKEANLRYESAAAQIKITAGQAQNAAIALGDNLKGGLLATLVPLRGFFEAVETAALRLSEMPIAIRGTIGGLTALAAGIPILLTALGFLAKAFVAVRQAAVIMGITTRTALISTGIGALIVGLGVAATFVIANWEKVGPFFKRFWNGLILVSAQGIDKFLAQIQVMTAWIPGAGKAIGAARKKLSNVIDWRKTRAQRLQWEKQVAEARRSAAEASEDPVFDNLEDAFDFDIDLGDLDGEGADKVTEVLTELEGALKNVGSRSIVFGSEVNATQEKLDAFQQAVVNLLDAGLAPADQRVQKLLDKINKLKQELGDLPTGPEESEGPELEPVDLESVFADAEKLEVPFIRFLENTQARAADWAEQIARVIGSGMDAAAEQFIAGVGKMAVGEASLGDVMSSVMGTLASLAVRVGKIVMGFGISVEAVRSALGNLTGFGAIAAGAALIALGSAVKAKLAAAARSSAGGSAGSPGSTTIGNFKPSVPDSGRFRGGRFDAPSGSTRTDSSRFGGGGGSQRTVVEINPQVTSAGDLEWSVREGERRLDRQGTDEI